MLRNSATRPIWPLQSSRAPLCLATAVMVLATIVSPAAAQQQDVQQEQEKVQQQSAQYVPATQLLPQSVAGLLRIPNFQKFRQAWDRTLLGQLLDEPFMRPFVEAQRARAKNYLESVGNRVGLRLEDLYELASGEVVVAWLPFEQDKRRPFSLVVVADVRQEQAKAQQALETIDQDLKAGGWERTDVTHREQSIRVYNTKPKPGQLKVEQVAVTLNETRLIAADRDSVVSDLLDAVAGEASGPPIAELAEFRQVLTKATQAIAEPIQQGGATVGAEYFAKPFQMARVMREAFEVDRGNQVDVVKLLENQGFDVIRSVGGILVMAGKKYDVLHQGYILADQSKLEKAARMLQLENENFEQIPAWVGTDAATLNRLNLDIDQAFWASETLINEAFGDEIFRDIIEGIRDDEEGPQIDLEKNVLPNLDDRILVVTDNKLPAEARSERLLLAIQVSDSDAIKKAVNKAMEADPDAKLLDVLPEVEIWKVERSDTVDDFDEELFGDLDLEFDEGDTEEPPPLLNRWAIALVPAGKSSEHAYLMFSSHPDMLIESAKRIQAGVPAGETLGEVAEIKQVLEAMRDLGCDQPAFNRFTRTRLSLRVKYELLRQGKLKESDTLLASLYRRIAENGDGGEPDPLNAGKLPTLEQVEPYLPDGGAWLQTHDDGWSLTGFLLTK